MNLSKTLKSTLSLMQQGRPGFVATLAAAKALDVALDAGAKLRDRMLFESVYREAHRTGIDYARNQEVRGKYAGEKLYILCTGPSLSLEDIEHLRGEHTLAVNGFVHAYGEHFEPTFYAMSHGAFYRDGAEDFFDKLFGRFDHTRFFVPHYAHDYMERKVMPNWESKRKDLYYVPTFFSQNVPTLGHEDQGHFREPDLTKQVIKAGNILLFCTLLGLELGFDEIYIMGADHNLLATNSLNEEYWDHCYEEETVPGLDYTPKDYIYKMKYLLSVFLHHERIKKVADQRGQKVFNVTRDSSYLDVYPYRHTDEVLGAVAASSSARKTG